MQLTESEQRALDIGHDSGDAVVLRGLCRRLLEDVKLLEATVKELQAENRLLRTLEHDIRRHFREEMSRTAVVGILDRILIADKAAKKPAKGAKP